MSMNRHRQTAQAMVEFLIIIPVLIMLIFGAAQAALIYSAKNALVP
jgi:Flp pilus assembly protein TadG